MSVFAFVCWRVDAAIDIRLSTQYTCSPDESLEKIQYTMIELKIRMLPVVKDGVIYGILTLGDVLNHQFR